MRPAGRIWVDVTGITPGSDAAVFSDLLRGALGDIGVDTTLCRREPGLRVFTWPEMRWCTELPAPLSPAGRLSWRQRVADVAPASTRRAVARFVQLQRAALTSGHGRTAKPPQPLIAAGTVSDTASPAPHDVLLMLGLGGDASRFAENGTRLAVLLVDATPVLCPDWMDQGARDSLAAWRSGTMPLLSAAMAMRPGHVAALERMGVAAVKIVPTGIAGETNASRLAPRRFVLAAGPIGVAGATANLILAWRRLMETMPADSVPELVLAGALGPGAHDALAQLRNSAGLGGKILPVLFPSRALLSALLRDCLFCIAPDVTCGWSRAAAEAGLAGRPCLAAAGTNKGLAFDPENAAALADLVRAWLEAPPRPAAAPESSWGELARVVARAVMA